MSECDGATDSVSQHASADVAPELYEPVEELRER